jgi:anti-sigma-K factor RskA
MNCTNTDSKLVDYIDGILSVEETSDVQKHIASCDSCKRAFEETKSLLTAFTNESIAQPTSNLKASFEEMLANEKKSQAKVIRLEPTRKNTYRSMLQIAASVAILFTGYLVGGYQESKNSQQVIASFQNEQKQLKENMMLAMIDNSSPSKRIKAVNYTEELTTPDTKILEALIDRMQNDSNSNVRLSAAEALSKFTDSELVRTSLIETLTTEKDPSIQIEVIQILVKIQEKRALDPMKKILEQPEAPNYLKTQVNIGIAKLI